MGINILFNRFLAARKKKQPDRDTQVYPRLMQLGLMNNQKAQMKPSPSNLRYFSRTPYARAAIRHIREPICGLEWEIKPIKGVKLNKHLEKQIEIATACFNAPNTDDNWLSFIGPVIEDFLIFGAGCIEQQLSNNQSRPLWMWNVDAQSIQIYGGWAGGKDEARYIQTVGYTNVGAFQGKKLRNDELIYIKANSSTDTPFGFGFLEIAFNTISRLLGVSDYSGNVATNAQPQVILRWKNATKEMVNTFRDWWRNEIEGQGQIPIVGGDDLDAVKLHSGGDEALYLKYQEFLRREIAVSFGLSPQNLGVESSLNRSIAEVADDRDWNNSIKPVARQFASHLTREALHMKLGFYQLCFNFVGLDREDEESSAKIYETYYKNNLMTPNEKRERLGMPPLDNEWSNMLYSDAKIAEAEAHGTKTIEDDNFAEFRKRKSEKQNQK